VSAEISPAGPRTQPAPAERPMPSRSTGVRDHRLRPIALGDTYDEVRSTREYHPYGLMVWDGYA
jgi:hypothetical protein